MGRDAARLQKYLPEKSLIIKDIVNPLDDLETEEKVR